VGGGGGAGGGVGAENRAWDVPEERDPETGATLFAHVYLLPQKGVYIIENLNLEELARDRRWEFAFLGIPLKLQGATGSPLRPLALVEEGPAPANFATGGGVLGGHAFAARRPRRRPGRE